MGTRKSLFDYLKQFQVNVIGIPIDEDFKKIKEILQFCDGVILPGGDEFYDHDFLLVDYLYHKKIPTLGICMGMQTMAEYFNNFQEEKVENHYSEKEYSHEVVMEEDSSLYKIIGKPKIFVNSRHHYAVFYTNLKVSAKSLDGIIEAVEEGNHPFFIGVQWHPENLNDSNSRQLFQAFIQSLF